MSRIGKAPIPIPDKVNVTLAGLAVTVVFAVPLLWLSFVVSRGFARLERSRRAKRPRRTPSSA